MVFHIVDLHPYNQGYTGRQVRHKSGRQTGWRERSSGKLYGQRSWSDNTRDTQKGFGYYVNRDRCVMKDGVYWGEVGGGCASSTLA